MSKIKRIHSKTNIYHIILRGINKQIIFQDEYDYIEFINIMKLYKASHSFQIYAYCLMDNHIHLLINVAPELLSPLMHKIEVKYVEWYNKKYQRTGHLFQGRFKSEPVEDEAYLLTVFRYIHQNPLNAGIEQHVSTYMWSSFNDYVTLNNTFVDIFEIISHFQNHESCLSFLQKPSKQKCMEYFNSKRIQDAEAIEIIKKSLGHFSLDAFQKMAYKERDYYILLLLEKGLSKNQLNRLTGISRTTISSIVNRQEQDKALLQ